MKFSTLHGCLEYASSDTNVNWAGLKYRSQFRRCRSKNPPSDNDKLALSLCFCRASEQHAVESCLTNQP
eukprot:scaffold1847_cov343-Prasinococcus_capsulatus_cf.AAC.3